MRSLEESYEIYDEIGYDWRAGKVATELAAVSGNLHYLEDARKKLARYERSWLATSYREVAGRLGFANVLPGVRLTPAQWQVFHLLADGFSLGEVAAHLGRSLNTIRNHAGAIYAALGVHSQKELRALVRAGTRKESPSPNRTMSAIVRFCPIVRAQLFLSRSAQMKLSIAAVTTVCAVLFTGCGGNLGGPIAGRRRRGAGRSRAGRRHLPSAGPDPDFRSAWRRSIPEPVSVDPAETQAAAYCESTKGVVETRTAIYGTNGSQPLALAGVARFCQYTKGKGSTSSRIHILLSTLYTTKPTLAALAYILKPPSGSCQGNPASCYCAQVLGGRRDRSIGCRRRLVQEELDRSSSRSVRIARHVVDRFVGNSVSHQRHHPRHRPHESHALQIPRLVSS